MQRTAGGWFDPQTWPASSYASGSTSAPVAGARSRGRFNALGRAGRAHRPGLDAEHGWVHVRRGMVELRDGSLIVGPPKSDARRRVVAIPASLLPDAMAAADLSDMHFHDLRQHSRGSGGRHAVRPDGADGSRERSRRTDLPAHDITSPGRGCAESPHCAGSMPSNGNAAGTRKKSRDR
jgi:hypothetical protein